jgi:hypothetical protein
MKQTVSLEMRILDCLKRTVDNDARQFMSYEDIAYDLWGTGHMRTSSSWKHIRHDLIDMVKQRMSKTRDLADQHNLILIADRPASKKDKRVKSNRVSGWKIAVSGFDEEFILDECMYKKRHVNVRQNSYNKLIDSVKGNNMLPEREISQLTA